MRTFAEKTEPTKQTISAKSKKPVRPFFGQSLDVQSVLHLQRTIGNQAVQRILQIHTEGLNAELTDTPSSCFRHDLSLIRLHHDSGGAIQTKLAINTPGDAYEEEADRVAEQVTKMPTPQLQPAGSCGGGSPKCPTEKRTQELERLQTKHLESSDVGQTGVPPIVHEVLTASGQPLDSATRGFMEPRFGHDFSQVLVYTGGAAERSSRDLNARAYTMKQSIVFGEGQFVPHTSKGKKLLAHELVHILQQRINTGRGSTNRQLLIQRDFINDAGGNPISYEFRVGMELEPAFVGLARRLTRDGLVTDDDLRQLRSHALSRRGTLNDHERMFMAGLLDPTNVATFNGTGYGQNFQFPTSSITRARRDHVNNLDRALPQPVQQEINDLTAAFGRGDVIGFFKEMNEVEAASARAILSGAGSFHSQARSLLTFIVANRISAANTLTAMIQGASDNSRGDRVLAGIVYAIGSHAGNASANRVAKGEIKVDALLPNALARVPGFTGNEEAAYVTAAQVGGAKGDTMYVKTDLDIENTFHRSVVIHELQHAQDDAASSATGPITFSIKNQLEARAYRSQARYIYNQLNSQGAAAQTISATEIAGELNGPLVVALVLEGKSNTAVNGPLFNLINQQVPAAQRLTTAQINAAFAESNAMLETRLLTQINTLYGPDVAKPGPTEGLAGESVMDWIYRL
jgi:hypothetical protein